MNEEKYDLYYDNDYAMYHGKVNMITWADDNHQHLIGIKFTQLDHAGKNIRGLESSPVAESVPKKAIMFRTIELSSGFRGVSRR